MRMKRFLLLAALTLAWGSLWAQDVVRDTLKSNAVSVPTDSVAVDDDDDEENVIGARPSSYKKGGEANILGAPIYYDSTGHAYGTGEPASRAVLLPHGEVSLRPVEIDNFNHFFLELEGITNYHNVAVGLNFTYLPRRVGVYGSALFGSRTQYFSLGAALRLSSATCRTDWQLYGGATMSRTLGAEAGLRLAETARNDGRFAWRSVSMGWALYNGHHYFTMGLSLEVTALIGLAFWWW